MAEPFLDLGDHRIVVRVYIVRPVVEPDVIEEPVVRDAEAAENGRAAVPEDVICKPGARPEIPIRRFPHAGDRSYARRGDGRSIISVQVRELRDDVIRLGRGPISL